MVASVAEQSVTNREIARYWKHRHTLEEDHLYAAMKSAARLRARSLSDDDYKQFEESLKEDEESMKKGNYSKMSGNKHEDKETRVGIKDWWTKSKYAYLNQPGMKLVDNPRRRSYKHHPQFFTCKSISVMSSKFWISQAI